MSKSNNELEQDLKQLVADVIGRDVSELKTDTNFWNDLGVDSIKAIEITVAIERKFKVSIRDSEIPKITNIGQAVEVIQQALEKKNAK
jgi:acyl carrier protein